MMKTKGNENEVSTLDSLAPQTISENTEITSVFSSTNNYTSEKTENQVTNNASSNLELPVKDGLYPSFRNGGKLNTYELAKYLMEHYHIINIQNRLYIYIDGIYENNMNLLDSLILKLAQGTKPVEKRTVLNDLMSIAPVKEVSNYNYIAFNNCIVDLNSLEVIKYKDVQPDNYIITSKVYANYDTAILETITEDIDFVKSFFDVISCGNTELKRLLFEIIGYCMVRTSKYQLGFILKGFSNNGKSDYLHIIEKLLGRYCVHQNLLQLSKPKTLMALYGCTANIVDDTCEIKKIDFAQIQSIISGGTISLDFNGKEDFSFAPYSTLILATNHYLCFKGSSRELMRRFLIIPFSANLDRCSDVDMTEDICKPKHLDIIATMSLQAFHKVIVDKKFHIPEVVTSCTKTFFLQANPVLEFIKSHPINRLISKSDYFAEFCRWCCQNNIEHGELDSTFGSQVIKYGYEPKTHSIEGFKDTYYQVLGYNMQSLKNEYEGYLSSLDNSDKKTMTLSEYILFLFKQDIKKDEVE